MCFDSANLQGAGAVRKRAGGGRREIKVREAGEQGTGGGSFCPLPPPPPPHTHTQMLRKETEGVNKASSGGGYIFKIGIGNGGIIFSENILGASVLKLYTFLKTTDPAGT